MLGKNTIETVSTEVMLIRCQNNVKRSMWRTHRCFVDFENRIPVEISTSSRCHNFHVDSSFKICHFDELSMWNFNVESMANRRGCVH